MVAGMTERVPSNSDEANKTPLVACQIFPPPAFFWHGRQDVLPLQPQDAGKSTFCNAFRPTFPSGDPGFDAPHPQPAASMSAIPALPTIPAKRYFTIGEVSELCGVKSHVLRYWEQEFAQLRPMKRRGNRRYYQHHEVLLIRRIRELLYDQGFTISGARARLGGGLSEDAQEFSAVESVDAPSGDGHHNIPAPIQSLNELRAALLKIRQDLIAP
jgi:DNA-binding transcriptional MerR regulator